MTMNYHISDIKDIIHNIYAIMNKEKVYRHTHVDRHTSNTNIGVYFLMCYFHYASVIGITFILENHIHPQMNTIEIDLVLMCNTYI